MIVCHARRFIFFHNPKCAGMAFRQALQGYHDDPFSFWGIYTAPYFRNQIDHSHLRLWEMQAQFPNVFACAKAYNTLIFVRDPADRFISAVNEHMKKFQQQIDLAAMDAAQRVSVVEQFTEKVLTVARITTDWRFVHFSPQTWFLNLGGRIVPRHIVPMDADGAFIGTALARLELPVLPVARVNPSPVDLRPALASKTVQDFIRSFYADDLAFLRTLGAAALVFGMVFASPCAFRV